LQGLAYLYTEVFAFTIPLNNTSHSAYQSLLTRLDEFIRKYYKNQMIRGAIYTLGIVVGAYLLVVLTEYFGRFNIAMRTVLFYGFLIAVLFVLVRFICIPLAHLFRIGKTLGHKEAAQILGTHFPNVQDKILNTLQLQSQQHDTDNSLLEASIQQKIAELRPIPFSSAVDFKENKKYLKWALPPVGLFLVLLFAAPSVITKPTDRLIRHGQIIPEEAPFTIKLLNPALTVIENQDIELQVELSGAEIPEKIFVLIEGQQYLMERDNPVQFRYTIKNIITDLPFTFFANGFHSETYQIALLPAPKLTDFSVQLDYPTYLHRPSENFDNTGDLLIPEGTKVTWSIRTSNASSLYFQIADSSHLLQNDEDRYVYSQYAYQSGLYSLQTANQFVTSKDSVTYRLQVIPDLYPLIAVSEEKDSASFKFLYFTGEVKDDYGFSRLTFNYRFSERNGTPIDDASFETIDIPVNKANLSDAFFYSWDLNLVDLQAGDKLTYYFEISDNDGVHGAKTSRSATREYSAPTLEELEKEIENTNENIKEKLEESIKESKQLQKQIEELQRQLLEKKEMTWQDKKKLEDMMKRQEELRKQIEEIQKENQQKTNKENEFKQQDESILEKQKQLEKLMEQVMNPELEQLMKEMQEMMEELNKDQIQEELNKMELNNEDIEKELDRALEQFKQLEYEQKMEKAIEKLEELGQKQEELGQKAEEKSTDSKELAKEQEELNKAFEEVKKELEEAEKLNEELEQPNETPDTEQQQQEIDQEQQKSSEELSKNKKSSASKSQKNAGKKMKEMAQSMQMDMAGGEQEQQEEDMAALRALLENLITLSVDQESLMGQFQKIDPIDPAFNKLGQAQRKLKDDSKMVEDSLFALSKRVPQISAAVNHEINLVNENMDKAIGLMPDREIPKIATSQQFAMTSFNNLALMLDEALKQMQNQASCNKPGKGNCEKPGGNGKKPSPSMSQLKKQQEALSKQLQDLKKQGKNQGQSQGGQQMSKQLSDMAAKQAAIRKAIEDKAGELNQDGSGNGKELQQLAKEMEELQKDIVNNRIDDRTLERQKDIEIRLLKAEEAERTRDKDNERKSNEAKDYPLSNPAKYEEYLRKKQQETELLKTVPPSLKPYYKQKANDYFNKIKQQ
jgi:hypothetical protein